jgi:hypothetical protein
MERLMGLSTAGAALIGFVLMAAAVVIIASNALAPALARLSDESGAAHKAAIEAPISGVQPHGRALRAHN